MVYDQDNVPTDPAVLRELAISQSRTINELNGKAGLGTIWGKRAVSSQSPSAP